MRTMGTGLPLFGFASMALILAGGIAGMPWLAWAMPLVGGAVAGILYKAGLTAAEATE
mgnify:CR=1 FL=1